MIQKVIIRSFDVEQYSIPECFLLTVSKLDYCFSVQAGVSATLQRRLQSLLIIIIITDLYSAFRSEDTEALETIQRCLHSSENFTCWRFQRESSFVYGLLPAAAFNSSTPSSLRLYRGVHMSSDVKSCHRLRSGSTSTLLVPSTPQATTGDRAFQVTTARTWSALPSSIQGVLRRLDIVVQSGAYS